MTDEREPDESWLRTEGLEDVDRRLRRAGLATAPGDFVGDVLARLAVARPDRTRRRWLLTAAALVAAAIGGGWIGRASTATPRPTYMLVIHEDLAGRLGASEDERLRRGQEFGAWVQGLRARRLLVGGHQLGADGGRLVAAGGIDDRSAGTPDGEVLTGLLLLRASSYDEATVAAETCPILRYGGRVLVRQIR